jgi:hypothetical protein
MRNNANIFKYLKLNRKKKHLMNYIFGQKSKDAEIAFYVVSRELANELEIYLASVDFYVEFPAKLYVNLNTDGMSVIAEGNEEAVGVGRVVVEFFCDFAGNIKEYKTGF